MTKHITPLKAIRAHCLDCCCGNMAEVKRCEMNEAEEPCKLWEFRMGHNPARKGIGGTKTIFNFQKVKK